MRTFPGYAKGFVSAFVSILVLTQAVSGQASGDRGRPLPAKATISAHGKLPLSFEPNRGQAGATTDFVARGQGYTLSLNASASTLALHRGRTMARRDGVEPGAGAAAPPACPPRS